MYNESCTKTINELHKNYFRFVFLRNSRFTSVTSIYQFPINRLINRKYRLQTARFKSDLLTYCPKIFPLPLSWKFLRSWYQSASISRYCALITINCLSENNAQAPSDIFKPIWSQIDRKLSNKSNLNGDFFQTSNFKKKHTIGSQWMFKNRSDTKPVRKWLCFFVSSLKI